MAVSRIFQASPCLSTGEKLQCRKNDTQWTPVLSCPADFPVELFEVALLQLIHHPEYNSTLILRSETIQETGSDFPASVPELLGSIALKNIHRKLLPRRPGRDLGLEQHCTLYGTHAADKVISTVVLTPILNPEVSLPYYHPAVFHIAFRYISAGDPRLQIEVVSFPETPLDLNSRLYRTCLALLETVHRYGWGACHDYKKRVHHDVLVGREVYQDLYQIMRARYKHLVDTWHESTDPLKHVFEDIGIATFLMLLWKGMYGMPTETVACDEDAPWKSWPRPPGGFVDVGCGNGLLVHILVSEGYTGYGTDVRARVSWSHFPEATNQNLRVGALDPTNDVSLPPGAFIIGNHADELTPWVPILAISCRASGYLNLPCCPWEFDKRYERSGTTEFPLPSADFVELLNLGGDGKHTSSYSMYRIWLAKLSYHCGWDVESEILRIPSTRNWALVGRTKHLDDAGSQQIVAEIIHRVRERGIFSTRIPEGKSRNH